MPRVKTFDQEEAVQSAMELFWQKGYADTSLSDLTAHLGIGKGSFYATFQSKEQLFIQCIERYTDANFPFLDAALDAEVNYKDGLKKLLSGYVDGLLQKNNRKGCFMANSCSLVHEEDSLVGAKIAEHYARIRAYFEAYLQKGGVTQAKAIAVSDTLITFLIGASQQSKVNRDRSSYLSTVDNIIRLLD